ncbi:MAG: glycoside hydrolase family 57 protein [Bacteroidales bacterium]|jgi:alpha-amylase|nr:glycoside hydrolase family 57 protein [Bacteroidales bacterium]
MHNLCIHFVLSQPTRLRNYRFFDINSRHDYFDEYQNHYLTNRIADLSYRPLNTLMLELIAQYGNKVAFSFSVAGNTLKMFQEYCPEMIDSFQKLILAGQTEFVGSTFTNSLASLYDKSTFLEQIHHQEGLLKELFGLHPTSFCNTACIYSDEIGEWLHEADYDTVLTEGARHILGWKHPGFLYCNPYNTNQKLVLRNSSLCNDIEFNFQNQSWDQFPLTAEKYLHFIHSCPKKVPLTNLYFDYEMFGETHRKESGIFDFFKAFCELVANSDDIQMITPSQIESLSLPTATMHAPWAISVSGEEKDTSEWLGNELQQEAFNQLFKLTELYTKSDNEKAKRAWLLLQSADHFNYMGSQWISHPSVKRNFDVYPSPYQAFINFMNVLNDVKLQLEKA